MGVCIRKHSIDCDVSLASHVASMSGLEYCTACIHGDNTDDIVTFVPYEGFLLRRDVPSNKEYNVHKKNLRLKEKARLKAIEASGFPF